MRVKLTDRFCASAKEGEWIDQTVSGLTLRVSKTGVSRAKNTEFDSQSSISTQKYYEIGFVRCTNLIGLETQFEIIDIYDFRSWLPPHACAQALATEG